MKTKIKKSLFLIIILITVLIIIGYYSDNSAEISNNPETYSLVKVYVNSGDDIKQLVNNDICIDHYQGKPGQGIEIMINQNELNRLKSLALGFEVLISDMNAFYAGRKAPTQIEMLESNRILSESNISGFSYGSMGGYYTYNEIVQKLDSMRIQFPNLITAKQSLGTTTESRHIYMAKISDNPDMNESTSEPAIYFDALHHAREPQSMACTMYFMYWLLENYGINPEATYLVNNREIFFVPVVNVDGYVYNQTTNPNGGGGWRKNRRNNGSCYGVDLNRNYNYGWGNNSGSSNDPCSETYRGPSAASEPETQAIKNLVQSILPKIGFSNHSVAGRYLNPYGYTDTSIAYDIYSEFSSDFASSNNYTYGTVNEMLQYYSSGTTRDFFHSIGTYCWTPEVSGSGFWPAQSEIIPIANETLPGYKYLSWVGGAFADFKNYKILGKGYVQKNDTLSLQVTLKNRGLSKYARNVTIDVTSMNPNVTPLVSSVNYDSIMQRSSKSNASNPVKFILNSSVNYMDQINLILSVKQEGVETSKDTIRINAGKTFVLFSDNAESGTSRWVKAGTGLMWDSTFIDPVDGSKNFSDSRYGNSKNSSNNTFTLIDTIDLTNTSNPRIEFTAKWAQEETYDYVRIQVSSNYGTTWTSQTGRYTRVISSQPSYSDIKHWVNEQINLNSYIGQKIRIRFNLVTDAGVPGDGFYFDNFKVVDYKDIPTSVTATSGIIPSAFSLYQNYPNPFNPETKINFDIPSSSRVILSVYDNAGRLIKHIINQQMNSGSYSVDFTANELSSGVYFYKLEAGNFSEIRKMILIR
ncbi:MAG: hypothetical protein HGGPFJEG_02619 [Ignavibacteria bacterium]|nr:hypothetical protein [Ignavibacteria bacterium]